MCADDDTTSALKSILEHYTTEVNFTGYQYLVWKDFILSTLERYSILFIFYHNSLRVILFSIDNPSDLVKLRKLFALHEHLSGR